MPKKRIINHLFGRDYSILSRFLEAVLEDEFVTFGDGFFGVVGVDPWSLNRQKGTPGEGVEGARVIEKRSGLARAKVHLEEPKDSSRVSIVAPTAQSRPQKKDSQQQALGQGVRVESSYPWNECQKKEASA